MYFFQSCGKKLTLNMFNETPKSDDLVVTYRLRKPSGPFIGLRNCQGVPKSKNVSK